MSIRLLFPTILLLVAAALAQQPRLPMAHMHAAADVLDGSKHPELIPDSAAYRLYFVAWGQAVNAGQSGKDRERGELARAGLLGADADAVMDTLALFKGQYAKIIADYNSGAEAAFDSGRLDEYRESFYARRDDLVAATRAALRAELSPTALASFDAHVQGEKRHMRVAKGDVQ